MPGCSGSCGTVQSTWPGAQPGRDLTEALAGLPPDVNGQIRLSDPKFTASYETHDFKENDTIQLISGSEPETEASRVLRGYLKKLAPRLNYRKRLAEGKSIGSGQVKGACKNLIGKRLKQTGARWSVRCVNRMATLCAVLYSQQWNAYWKASEIAARNILLHSVLSAGIVLRQGLVFRGASGKMAF